MEHQDGMESPTGKLQAAVDLMTKTAIMKGCDSGGLPEAIFIALCGMSGAALPLCDMISKRNPDHVEGDRDTSVSITSDQSLMFTGLLLVAALHTHKCGNCDDDHPAVDFGPDKIIKALEMYETLTGERPDKYLNDTLVRNIRKIAAEADEPLTDFLDKIRSARPNSLN